jgi:hypothetical protein
MIIIYHLSSANRRRAAVRKKRKLKKFEVMCHLGFLLLLGGELSAQTSAPKMIPVPEPVKTLLKRRCADCHKGDNPPRGLNLEPGRIRAAIDAASKEKPALKILDPANPNESYVLKKVRGDGDIVGGRMPLNRTALTPAEVEILKTWIYGLKTEK